MKLRIALLVSCLYLLAPAAKADGYTEVAGTPRATVQGIQIGIWATNNFITGTYIALVEKSSTGAWLSFWSSIGYAVPADVATNPDAARVWLVQLMPEINVALKKRYTTGGGPPQSGDPVVDNLNNSLANNFKFTVDANGTPVLGTK